MRSAAPYDRGHPPRWAMYSKHFETNAVRAWLHVLWNKIISAVEGVLELFQNYFSDNVTMNTLENIHELQL